MNTNRNEPKQLDCTLKCTASASCDETAQEDLLKPDKTLAELLKEEDLDADTDNNKAGS